METRANYIAVGFFTITAMILAFVVVYWFGRYDGAEELVPLDIRIEGSVSGLGAGSYVRFNGIEVGRVSDLQLDPEDPRHVVVKTMVNRNVPIRQDTRASVGIRGLSGGAFIALEGGTADLPLLLKEVSPEGPPARIEGDPAAIADLLERVNELTIRAEKVVETVEQFVTSNSETVSRTLSNAEVFSKALADNADGVNRFLSSASDVAVSLENLSGKLDGSVSQAEAILNAVEPGAVKETVDGARDFVSALARQRDSVSEALKGVTETAERINVFSQRLNASMDKIDAVIEAVDPATLRTAVDDIGRAAKSAGAIVERIDPAKVEQTIDDLSQTASAAREISSSIDSQALKGLVDDLSSASSDVAELVAALDSNQMNQTVGDIASAARDAQKVVEDVSQVTRRFADRGDDVDKIFDDAVELSQRLNASSKRVDGLLDQVDSILGSDAADGVIAEARETLASFRRSAANLDQRVNEVAAGINRFTGRGLGDTQTLIRDARRSINRIDRVIRNLENNPSALITGAGGSRIRESSGSRPRR